MNEKYQIDLLCNLSKMQQFTNEQKKKQSPITYSDDNAEIMKLLKQRLELGKNRYGHGVIVDDDTKKYGTQENDWELMALEELLDGLIYTTAAIIRCRRRKKKCYNDKITNDDSIVKYKSLK